jgi:hypothetical protein
MFKTSEKNIPQIKATIKVYGQCWFHGCGNIYDDKAASDFRQKFTNPNSEESVYRIHFTSIDQVPATTEELNKKLMASRSQEMVQEKMPKASQGVKTISVEPEAEVEAVKTVTEKTAEEIEFDRLLAEENAKKGK